MPLLASFVRRLRSILTAACAAAFSLLVAGAVYAQSTDVRFPTPVQTNEVVGAIAARDIGDARLTDYFYTFAGVPGDLLITFESKNLNGDLDVFTAGELRPLLKITVYAESGSAVTKNIYFRKREGLILRVEARTPNDDEGTYHIRFSGSFEPATEAPLLEAESRTAAASKPASRSSGRKVTKVSSVGARIAEPPPDVAALSAPTPAASPQPATPEESTEAAKPAPRKSTKTGRASARRTRAKPAAPTETTKTATGETAETNKESAETGKKEEPAKKEASVAPSETPKVTSESESKPKLVRRGTARRSPSPASAKQPAAEPPPESGPRLVIEVKDGTRIEYFMNTVRRVTVQNDQIVIVGKDGSVERVPMANVVRMSIGP